MEFAAATGTAANGGDSVLQAEPQDSWTGVVKITGTHTTRRLKKSDMSQESRVKSQEEFDNSQFPIPNSQLSGDWRILNSLGILNFFGDWRSGAVTLVFGKTQ